MGGKYDKLEEKYDQERFQNLSPRSKRWFNGNFLCYTRKTHTFSSILISNDSDQKINFFGETIVDAEDGPG